MMPYYSEDHRRDVLLRQLRFHCSTGWVSLREIQWLVGKIDELRRSVTSLFRNASARYHTPIAPISLEHRMSVGIDQWHRITLGNKSCNGSKYICNKNLIHYAAIPQTFSVFRSYRWLSDDLRYNRLSITSSLTISSRKIIVSGTRAQN